MKRGLLLILSIAVLSVIGLAGSSECSMSKKQVAEIVQKILQKNQEITKNAQNLDPNGIYNTIHDGGKGTIIIDGRVFNYQEALENSKRGYAGLKEQKVEFSYRNVKVLSPEIAIFTGQGKSTFIIDTNEVFITDFAVTSVFALKDNEWKIVHGHHSTQKRN